VQQNGRHRIRRATSTVIGLLAFAAGLCPALSLADASAVAGAGGAPMVAAATAAGIDPAHHHMDAMTADEHAHHAAAPSLSRTVVSYQTPDVQLVREDGQRVGLRAEIDDGRPVVLAFIYTSCSAVCPLTSQTLSALQDRLGADRSRVHLVSISIDPEQDTPARLREYAQRFHAGAQWHYYTGSLAATQAAQRAFDVYRGDKMSHSPVVLVRPAPGDPWVRLDGFATADQLYAELPHPIFTAKR
jgi:protein SCO1/2